jgi:hypothetical protein
MDGVIGGGAIITQWIYFFQIFITAPEFQDIYLVFWIQILSYHFEFLLISNSKPLSPIWKNKSKHSGFGWEMFFIEFSKYIFALKCYYNVLKLWSRNKNLKKIYPLCYDCPPPLICGAGTAYPPGISEITPDCSGVRIDRTLVFCVMYIVVWFFFFSIPFSMSFFNSRLLVGVISDIPGG